MYSVCTRGMMISCRSASYPTGTPEARTKTTTKTHLSHRGQPLRLDLHCVFLTDSVLPARLLPCLLTKRAELATRRPTCLCTAVDLLHELRGLFVMGQNIGRLGIQRQTPEARRQSTVTFERVGSVVHAHNVVTERRSPRWHIGRADVTLLVSPSQLALDGIHWPSRVDGGERSSTFDIFDLVV